MKTLILFLFLLISLIGSSQTSPNVKAKTKVQTEQSLTKSASKSIFLYKGLPVYKSNRNNYFIVKKSTKTGEYYKIYLTLQ